MSSTPLRIEIETSDKEFLRDLQVQKIEGLRLMTRSFTCDSAEWIPPVEKVLHFIVEVSFQFEISLLTAWLYDRFKAKPPEKVKIDGATVEPERVTVVINNYVQNIQVNNINDR